jgi:hypothetical protein
MDCESGRNQGRQNTPPVGLENFFFGGTSSMRTTQAAAATCAAFLRGDRRIHGSDSVANRPG